MRSQIFFLQSIEDMISMMPAEIADMMRATLRFLRDRHISMSDPRFAQLDKALQTIDQHSSLEDCKKVTILFERYFAAPSDPALDEIIRFLPSIRKQTEVAAEMKTADFAQPVTVEIAKPEIEAETAFAECDCDESLELLQIQTMIMQIQSMMRLLKNKERKIRQCCAHKCKYCGK